jgi:hypothetical protein
MPLAVPTRERFSSAGGPVPNMGAAGVHIFTCDN